MLVIFFKIFWRPGEPPILLFIRGYQWLQATILVFNADWQGLPLRRWIEASTSLKRPGIRCSDAVVAAGLRMGAGPSYASMSDAGHQPRIPTVGATPVLCLPTGDRGGSVLVNRSLYCQAPEPTDLDRFLVALDHRLHFCLHRTSQKRGYAAFG